MLKTNELVEVDKIIEEITDYVLNKEITSEEAYRTAHYVLIDSIGCGIIELNHPECTKLLGTHAHGKIVSNGVSVYGTYFDLDHVNGALTLYSISRWFD